MFVHRPRLKTQGAVVTTVAMLALGACEDPTARTDLRPEGPPEVLAVLVLSDALGGLVETATHCKANDEKRPGLVGLPDFTTQQVCPEDLTQGVEGPALAAPDLWYVRVMFDELLDPTVEDLDPVRDELGNETGVYIGTIARTKPVTLQCQNVAGAMVDVDYDGYYGVSGNAVTWPVGPSLVVRPVDPTVIAVDSECQLTLKDTIRDKSGEAIPADQRGPFKFRLAPIEIIDIFPGDGSAVDPENDGADLTFNVEVDSSDLTEDDFTFSPEVTNKGVFQYGASGLFLYADILDSKEYSFELAAGTKLKDRCGKEGEVTGLTKTTFRTRALSLVNITPFQGPNALPSRKIRFNFNQYMDPASLVEGTDYEWLSEKPEGWDVPATGGFKPDGSDPTVLVATGQYKLGTNYKLRLIGGGTVADCPSNGTNGGACVNSSELTLTEQTIDITTATAIANTSNAISAGPGNSQRTSSVVTISGSGGQTVRKIDPAENVFVRLSFNQDMMGSTLTDAEYTLTNADNTPTGIPIAVAATGSAATLSINLGALPAGSYKFTLKDGATIDDRISTPDTYTQSGDRTFTFNVAVAVPAPFKCLGQP